MIFRRYPKHWFFISEARRDAYLCRAVARGLHVKALTVPCGRVPCWFVVDHPPGYEPDAEYAGRLFTVVDVDKRVGK